MERTTLRACLLTGVCAAAISLLSLGAKAQDSTATPRKVTLQATDIALSAGLSARSAKDPQRITTLDVPQIAQGNSGSVAGVPPGTNVYSNVVDPITQFYQPLANLRMAEDIELADGACEVTYYDIAVASDGTLPFDAHVELWDGNPCDPASSPIPGTADDFLDLTPGPIWELPVTLAVPVSTSGTIYIAATFSTSDAGWILAGTAEVGFTDDAWSQYDPTSCTLPGEPTVTCCDLWFGGVPYAGFWANVNCNVNTDPIGACCDGVTCSEITEAQCPAGNWQGPFTSCTPSPCLTGGCCTGDGLATCTDTTEAGCIADSGVFHPQEDCASAPCQPSFLVYQNDQELFGFFSVNVGSKLADDQTAGPGAPCDLAVYEVDVFAPPETGLYDVTMELWTSDPASGEPLLPIPGTTTVFSGLRDGSPHRLVAGPFSGITLPQVVWMVMTTTTPESGWMIGSEAILGFTEDVFAIHDGNSWLGFDFDDQALWSGFRANTWCYGDAPTGACCNDGAGTCVDGVTILECEGRWAVGLTCDQNPFDPPCGTNACCTLFGCIDNTPAECAAFGGAVLEGQLCGLITCPIPACIAATGDCLSTNPTPGCDQALCCDLVCDPISGDPFCCDPAGTWDDFCAETALAQCTPPPPTNNHCGNALPIAGEGAFAFDNEQATMDGAPHDGCLDGAGEDGIRNDVWFLWESPCTDTVFARTCGLTSVDTKIAAYDGDAICPPADASLLDCNDDLCGFAGGGRQSQVSFEAIAGNSYLLRVGTFPGEPGGVGRVEFICGVPQEPVCGGVTAGDCCEPGTEPGCVDEVCCQIVCACDPFCCEVAWDDSCATVGENGSSCGAQLLCPSLCGLGACPEGPVVFIDPPDGVIDARQPYPPRDAASPQGIITLHVEGPAGLDIISCWSLCETMSTGTSNGISNVVDNGDGTYFVDLLRPITPGAVTTVSHTSEGGVVSTAVLTFLPGNVDADTSSSASDILEIIDVLNGAVTSFWGEYSTDVDRSGVTAAGDILRVIDLLNGADQLDPWLGVRLPSCAECCP